DEPGIFDHEVEGHEYPEFISTTLGQLEVRTGTDPVTWQDIPLSGGEIRATLFQGTRLLCMIQERRGKRWGFHRYGTEVYPDDEYMTYGIDRNKFARFFRHQKFRMKNDVVTE